MLHRSSTHTGRILFASLLLPLLFTFALGQVDAPKHGQRVSTLVIAGGMMVDGNGTPAEGPVDIVIKNNRISRISRANPDADYRQQADAVIDADGKYVLPGFINMHGHLQDERAGMDQPYEYQYKLWLGSGITTIRDVGSNIDKAPAERRKSERGSIAAPRIFLYMWFPGGANEAEIRKSVRDLKKKGADGIKIHQRDLASLEIIADEARKQGLKIAIHMGVEDAVATDAARLGITSIEHWYGVPDAALDGGQDFPADFNYSNELDRFRYAGRLWREAQPDKLLAVLQAMADAGTAWDPTLCIYEASRDVQRALTQPWFDDYLHPALEKFFTPSPDYHGSYFFGWTHTDEVYWRENYRIWMAALRDFERMGGVITTGEDAGFIYQMYGFGYLRELQLHEEAGFRPLEVITHATINGARVLGKEDELGRIKVGYLADLIVVDGNPLANLKILLPNGLMPEWDTLRDNRGGIEWTIKDGIPYHAPTLFEEVRTLVRQARDE